MLRKLHSVFDILLSYRGEWFCYLGLTGKDMKTVLCGDRICIKHVDTLVA